MAKMGHIIAPIIILLILPIMDMALVENKLLIIIRMVMKKYQQHQCQNHQSMIATMRTKVHYYHKAIQNIINNGDLIQILDTHLQEQLQIKCESLKPPDNKPYHIVHKSHIVWLISYDPFLLTNHAERKGHTYGSTPRCSLHPNWPIFSYSNVIIFI